MTDDSARLEALLHGEPFFAALERVELARLVGALWLWFRPGTSGASSFVSHQEHVLGPLTARELVTIGALAIMIIGLLPLPLLHVNPVWFAVGALSLAIGGGGLTRDLFRRAID